jgi:hypothetical protein
LKLSLIYHLIFLLKKLNETITYQKIVITSLLLNPDGFALVEKQDYRPSR